VLSHFQFGWIANPDLVNNIAMTVLPLPSLIVINTTTNHHHVPEDDTKKLTPYVIELFLEQIRNESAPVQYCSLSLHVYIPCLLSPLLLTR
jgi:thioredoxin domain-containing protein 10